MATPVQVALDWCTGLGLVAFFGYGLFGVILSGRMLKHRLPGHPSAPAFLDHFRAGSYGPEGQRLFALFKLWAMLLPIVAPFILFGARMVCRP